MRILLVEDELTLAKPLVIGLRKFGFAVDHAEDGKSGLKQALINNYDCLVLDINLPELNGFDLASKLRKDGHNTPIIMLTARYQLGDKLTGFGSGADDYLTKPFDLSELVARIKAITKRSSENKSFRLSFNQFELLPERNVLIKDSKEISLSTKEAAILEYLIRNKNRLVSAEELLEHVWDGETNPFSDTVRTHIKTLRKKFDNTKRMLQSIRGKGYILKDEDETT